MSRTKKEKRNGQLDRDLDACSCPDCRLPSDGPPAWLRDKAVPVWTGDYFMYLEEELGEEAAEECVSAFAHGFEQGLITAMLKPEWTQAFYLKLRAYYLLTHTEGNLEAWEERAAEMCRAIPIELVSPATQKTT